MERYDRVHEWLRRRAEYNERNRLVEGRSGLELERERREEDDEQSALLYEWLRVQEEGGLELEHFYNVHHYMFSDTGYSSSTPDLDSDIDEFDNPEFTVQEPDEEPTSYDFENEPYEEPSPYSIEPWQIHEEHESWQGYDPWQEHHESWQEYEPWQGYEAWEEHVLYNEHEAYDIEPCEELNPDDIENEPSEELES